ncbi:hypothetical protein GCM10009745_77120 [Kribbella yunnanensis]|uniref:Serine/threonine protein kinase n=1 Tax=Kribbella yunnanensis TaxID=190194 RepID=A0ABP4V819_9ACTN
MTTLAIIGGATVWSNSLHRGDGPAGSPRSETITVDPKTGQVVDNETGLTAQALPPVSPLSDAEVLKRCEPADQRMRHSATDEAGPVDARWKVVLKSGDQQRLQALFLSPDRSVVFGCTMKSSTQIDSMGRFPTTSTDGSPKAVLAKAMIPATGVTHVLATLDGESAPRQALVAEGRFFTLGPPTWRETYEPVDGAPTIRRIRAYDATGKRVYDWKYEPPAAEQPVPPDVKIKTASPIEPRTLLTKDPDTGKPLAVVPFSPLSDEQVRAECKRPDDAYFDGPGNGLPKPGPGSDPRVDAAGRISPDWVVALKVGSAERFTALVVSPGQNVVAWCYRDGKTAYDYTRSGVHADGTFGDPAKDLFRNWAMVPDGVAQIIVDLPTGPVRAAISNGYYLWGTTGGSENFKKVRVRGYDADAKLVYDKKITVDAS